jgi:hypothetical protein
MGINFRTAGRIRRQRLYKPTSAMDSRRNLPSKKTDTTLTKILFIETEGKFYNYSSSPPLD